MLREWSTSRTPPSTTAPISPCRLPTVAEVPPRLETLATPWITSTSPALAMRCALISPRPDFFDATASGTDCLRAWLSTVSALPTMRAPGSLGLRMAAGTAPTMPSWSRTSETVPVRSPRLRNASTILSVAIQSDCFAFGNAKSMDRLRCMQVFVEVARDGSFTGAARRLGMSKASVTKHVAWLESSLRARLLNRTTKQVGLTDAGLSMLPSARVLLERYDEIGADVRDSIRQPKGMIRVGTPPSFGAHHLAPLVMGFTALHPEIQVALILDDGSANLIAQGLDLSVRIAPELEDASYVAQPLTKAPQALVASSSYLGRHGVPQAPADLARHNYMVQSIT